MDGASFKIASRDTGVQDNGSEWEAGTLLKAHKVWSEVGSENVRGTEAARKEAVK